MRNSHFSTAFGYSLDVAKKLSRKHFLAGAAPLVAAAPIVHYGLAAARRRRRVPSATHLRSRPRPRRHGPCGDDRRGGALDRAQRATSTRCSLPPPAAAAPARPGARVQPARRSTRRSRSRRASPSPPGRTTAPRPGPVIRATEDDLLRVHFTQRRLAPAHDPLPRHPPGEHGRRLRDRRAGRLVHVRVPGAAVRDAPLPLPRDAAEEAHPQGPLRRLHHRPAEAAQAGAGARDGDERLRHRRRRREQLLHRQRAAPSTTRATRSGCAARRRCASTSPT